MEKLALCDGKNNYPTSPLSGCVNDANDVADCLEGDQWKTIRLLDNHASVEEIEYVMTDYAKFSHSVAGKCKVFWSNSSHGTDYPDFNGDEVKDQALYLNRLWLDDDICKMLLKFHPDTDLGVLFDSCFSRTATRFVDLSGAARARYISIEPVSPTARFRKRIARLPVEQMFWYHFAGCGSDEYSYDASFNGRPNGAMTYYWLKSLAEGRAHKSVYDLVRRKLPTNTYPQTPDLEGYYENRFLLGEAVDPTPTPARLTCWQRFINSFKN